MPKPFFSRLLRGAGLLAVLLLGSTVAIGQPGQNWERYTGRGPNGFAGGGFPDGRGAGPAPVPPPQRQGQGEAQQDKGRAQGRMSPEERRNLRRQINEAGQDIYVPPRR